MAQKVITTVELTDDLDGGRADTTVSFTVDGAAYEIDLSKKNSAAFYKALKPYVESARKARATTRRRAATAGSSRRGSRSDLGEVRAWANNNGYSVSERGRIPAAVLEAYDAK